MEAAALGLKVEGVAGIDRASNSLDDLSGSAERAERSSKGLEAGSKKAGREVENTGNRAKVASASISKMATAISLAAAAAGGFVLRRVIRETAAFEDAMLGLQSVSRATADEMASLEAQARTLGATSMFSAQQAGEAQKFLAQAGFQVNEVLSATPGILNLAAAGQMNLAQAADIASNVLGGMRLEVEELNRVNDVLAGTAAGSNTSIQQLGQALSTAAPLAAAASISIEETAAAIGVLSDAGIQGSRAGTGLQGVIRQLSNVTPAAAKALEGYGLTLDQVNVETRGLANVLETLQGANISTADAFKIFGSEAGAAAQILINGNKRLAEFTGELGDAEGEAKRMANTISSGLTGSMAGFNSMLSESLIALGRDDGVAGGFQAVVDAATGVLAVYNDMLPEFAEANDLSSDQAENLQTAANTMKALAGATAGAGAVYVTLATATRAATVAQIAFNAAARANPYLLAVTALAAAAGAIYSLSDSMDPAIERAENLKEAVGGLTENLDLLTRAELENRRSTFAQDMLESRTEAEKLSGELETIQEKIRNSGQLTPQGGAMPIATTEDINRARELAAKVDELTLSADASEGAVAEVNRLIESLGETSEKTTETVNTLSEAIGGDLTDAYDSLIKKLDPAKTALNDYFDTLEQIDALDLSERETDRLREAAYEQHWQRMADIANEGKADIPGLGDDDEEMGYWDRWLESAETAFTDFDQLAANTAERFTQGFGDAFESVIFDFESLEDAGKTMLEGLLRGTVNALGQMAAQWLAYQAVQMATSAATGTAAATALTTEAAAAQQLAGIHAFSSTAAIPVVGPPAAPAAMAAALAATAPSVAAVGSLSSTMAASQAASGFRQGGYTGDIGINEVAGPVHGREYVFDAASTARIGVENLEAMRSGKGTGAGGNNTVVNIHNAPPGTETRERTEGDGTKFVDVFIGDITSNGPMARSLQTTYGIRRQGR